MRAAGIDLGKVRVGLAVADELGALAHPRPYLDGRDPKKVLRALSALAEAEGITCFVVGLPTTLDGREGPPARRARKFAAELRTVTGREVHLVDERWTTKDAMGRLRAQGLSEREARQRVDSAAAAILLQGFLEAQRSDGPACSDG